MEKCMPKQFPRQLALNSQSTVLNNQKKVWLRDTFGTYTWHCYSITFQHFAKIVQLYDRAQQNIISSRIALDKELRLEISLQLYVGCLASPRLAVCNLSQPDYLHQLVSGYREGQREGTCAGMEQICGLVCLTDVCSGGTKALTAK